MTQTTAEYREKQRIYKVKHRGEQALRGPVATAINRAMKAEGGQPVRFRVRDDSSAMFWVQRADGRTVSAKTLVALGKELGVRMPLGRGVATNGASIPAAATRPSHFVSCKRAVRITGYSSTALRRAVAQGELTLHKIALRYPKQGQHRNQDAFDRAEVEAWAVRHREAGPRNRPRRSKNRRHVRYHLSAATATPVAAPKPSIGHSPRERLARYLAQFSGTPMETSVDQFIDRLIVQALERVKA